MAGWVENIPKFFVSIIVAIVYAVVNEIRKLFLTVIVTVLIPTLFHILGMLLSSWISDERCNFGLFWKSCKQDLVFGDNILNQDSQGFGWSVTGLMVTSTFILAYGCHAFSMSMLELKDRNSIKTCCSLVISGILDLGACLLVRSCCGDLCNLGASYYLTSVAGWMLVLSGTLLMTAFLYFDRNEKRKTNKVAK